MTHKWAELTKHFTEKDRERIEAEKERLRKELAPTADEIAEQAESGQDVSQHFTNDGVMKPPFKEVIDESVQNHCGGCHQ